MVSKLLIYYLLKCCLYVIVLAKLEIKQTGANQVLGRLRNFKDLKEDGLEIISSYMDREVVIWIWCASQEALQYLKTIYESNDLAEAMAAGTRISSMHRPTSKRDVKMIAHKVNIDREQFKKEVVSFTPFLTFAGKLDVGGEKVVGVSKLRNRYYVLSRSYSSTSPCVIFIFDDRHPFRLQKKLKLNEIKLPWDIDSSDGQNCLYVVDYQLKCIWKITIENDDDHPTIVKWLSAGLEWPFTLSTNREGHLLMVNMGHPVSSLKLYGSDAIVRFSVQLPEEIQEPFHAVETLNGNFVLVHRMLKEDGKDTRDQIENENNREKRHWICVVSEIARDTGTFLRLSIPHNDTEKLNFGLEFPPYLSVDLEDRVFLADTENDRVVLLNFDLSWNRILLPPTKEEDRKNAGVKRILSPWLFYDKDEKNVVVRRAKQNREGVFREDVNVYSLNIK